VEWFSFKVDLAREIGDAEKAADLCYRHDIAYIPFCSGMQKKFCTSLRYWTCQNRLFIQAFALASILGALCLIMLNWAIQKAYLRGNHFTQPQTLKY